MSYSPIERSIWEHPALEGLAFEGKAFYVFLWSHHRIRPSGIYRVTDAQLHVDTGLPLSRVTTYLATLASRGRIVRDGAWLFVRGYLKRQAKHPAMLRAAQLDVYHCTSLPILDAWDQQYPSYSRWSADRRATLGRGSLDASAKVVPLELELESELELQETKNKNLARAREPREVLAAARDVLSWLNHKAGKSYRLTGPNLELVLARLRDGFEVWQLKAIVSRKVREWASDPKMARYLRPETLFNRTKCESYVGELPPTESNGHGMP